jgi:ABC-type lipoprotein export system ATPase subunit
MRGRSFGSVFHAHAEVLELMRCLNQEQVMAFLVMTHDLYIAGGVDRVVYLGTGSYSPLTK